MSKDRQRFGSGSGLVHRRVAAELRVSLETKGGTQNSLWQLAFLNILTLKDTQRYAVT